MPVKTRRSNIKADRRSNPYRDARTRSNQRQKEQRRIALTVKRFKPEPVRNAPVVCVKPICKTKLRVSQLRKVKHVPGTSSPSHPTFTRSPKLLGLNSSVCSNSDCKCRGKKMFGAHVSIRISRKIRQYAIVPTCPSCNARGEPFEARRGTPVFILGRVRSMHPSKAFDPTKDTIIDKGIFKNGSKFERLEQELLDCDQNDLNDELLLDSFTEDYFRAVQ